MKLARNRYMSGCSFKLARNHYMSGCSFKLARNHYISGALKLEHITIFYTCVAKDSTYLCLAPSSYLLLAVNCSDSRLNQHVVP